jgi:cytochrome P450
MTEAATEPVTFNPLDPAFRIDPYPAYTRLREEAPVLEMAGLPGGAWVFSRYADCLALLRDPRASSDPRNSANFQNALQQGMFDEGLMLDQTPSFLFLDPPDHTRLRGLVSKAFTPRVVEGLRPRIQQLVDGLLDRAIERGSLELIEDLAYPLPVNVICEMLGVPPEDHVTFRDWSREAARSLDPVEVLPPEIAAQRQRTFELFQGYFRELIAQRRQAPRDDLLSALIAAEEAGDTLTEEELLSICILLLVAGHETTVNLIGNGTLALLRHPDQLALLRDDPSLTRGAVEEVLRYDPPVQFTGRIAKEEIEIAGVTVRPGQQTILLLAAANRDSEQFEDAQRFDITRKETQHLAFSFGIHYCLGAPLARLEGEIALGTLVRRLCGLELLTDPPEYKENIVLRGLAALPVGFASAS